MEWDEQQTEEVWAGEEDVEEQGGRRGRVTRPRKMFCVWLTPNSGRRDVLETVVPEGGQFMDPLRPSLQSSSGS